MEIKYIENKKEYGIDFDFKAISREFKKLKIPKDVYNPLNLPIRGAKYFTLLSDRSTGKTTNILLYGMVFNKLYGTQIQYLRKKESMIWNKNINDLFSTILEYGYVEKLTDGKYNSIIYKSRRWYYCHINEANEVDEVCNDYFMICLSYDKNEIYKSSYTTNRGDFIIVDEFISEYYYPNEFVKLCDLLSTIIRQHRSPLIFLLANTIDKHSQYFNELDIYDDIQLMNVGDREIITSELGTRVYVEIIGISKETNRKNIVNSLFFGFSNPLLASITGTDWAINNYPHITMNGVILTRRYYLEFNGKLLNLEIVRTEEVGLCVWVHRATRTYNDSRIYTINDIYDRRHIFKFGESKVDSFIWSLYQKNKFYYADNNCGSMICNYIKQASKL